MKLVFGSLGGGMSSSLQKYATAMKVADCKDSYDPKAFRDFVNNHKSNRKYKRK